MKDSLSVIFPVRDKQGQIRERIEALLDYLCEMSNEVQLIAVDDESRDATPEVLEELRRQYPQVDVVRKQNAVGPAHAVESTLYLARGEFIFLHQSYDAIDFEEIAQLWNLRKDEQLVIARAATRIRRIDQQMLQRLQEWGRKLEESWPANKVAAGSLQMMNRSRVTSLSGIKDSLTDLEVTHQSHRRITAPKLSSTKPTAAVPTVLKS
jgi:glycosyltransferase involved in cell wall biosynthesis